MNRTPLLEAYSLTKYFPIGGTFFKKRYIRAVEDVSFTIYEDDPIVINLAGESGSGKTTIANMILGLIKPTKGEVRYRGRNIYKLSKGEWRNYRRDIQAVFQDPYGIYNPFYRIDRVLKIPIVKFKLASSKSEEQKIIFNALEAVGLRPKDVLGRYPHQLSGGERQRVMLARLHIVKPKVLVADEPVSMIDASLRSIFLNTLLEFKKQYGMSCLFITHNLIHAEFLGGRLLILYRGRILERGSVRSIIEKPAHPYTRILISSIPTSDPKKRWKEKLELKTSELTSSGEVDGCRFYGRCPYRMEVCAKKMPEMVPVEEDHQVACHLYSKM